MTEDELRQRLAQQNTANQTPQQPQTLAGGLLNFLAPATTKALGGFSGKPVNEGDILKSILEIGSFAVPFGRGASLASKVLVPGAAVGGLQALSKEGANPASVITGAAGGAAGAGILDKIVGPLAGKLMNRVKSGLEGQADKFTEAAAQGVVNATKAQEAKFGSKYGMTTGQAHTRIAGGETNITKLVGPISAKGEGGLYQNALNEAEKVIQGRVKKLGNTVVASSRELKAPLLQRLEEYKAAPVGNEDNIAAIEDAIASIDKNYKKGATAKQLLDIKKQGDSPDVAFEDKGARDIQTKKMLSNVSRGILKNDYPDIRDALDIQSHALTLAPLIHGSRAAAKVAKGGVSEILPLIVASAGHPVAGAGLYAANKVAQSPTVDKLLGSVAGKAASAVPTQITNPLLKGALMQGASRVGGLPLSGGVEDVNQANNNQNGVQSGTSIPQSTTSSKDYGPEAQFTTNKNPLEGWQVNGQPISPELGQLVKGIADYRIDISKVTSLRSDQRQKLAELVAQYDPNWDQTAYASRAAARKDFTSGNSAKAVTSLNTAIGHLQSLAESGSKLGNTPIQALNKIKNIASKQAGQPQVVAFNNALNAVAGEMATVFKGTSGTDQEIKSWREQMNDAQSPEQIQAGIAQMIDLMGSRLAALDAKWQTGIGKPKDFRLLSSKSRNILSSLGIDPNTIDPVNQ